MIISLILIEHLKYVWETQRMFSKTQNDDEITKTNKKKHEKLFRRTFIWTQRMNRKIVVWQKLLNFTYLEN